MGRILPDLLHPEVETVLLEPFTVSIPHRCDVLQGVRMHDQDERELLSIKESVSRRPTFPHREPNSIHSPTSPGRDKFEPPVPAYARRKQRFAQR